MEMMLGKRSSGRPSSSRHPMRRTTSMTEFAPPDVLADVAEEDDEEDSELQLMPAHAEAVDAAAEDSYGWAAGGAAAAGMRADWLASYRARGAGAAADLSAAEMSAAFLRTCGICNRRLGPGRDTFMYRGDTAFCSLECRQQHITIEEWKEKCTALATTPAADTVAPASAGPKSPPPGARSPRSEAACASWPAPATQRRSTYTWV